MKKILIAAIASGLWAGTAAAQLQGSDTLFDMTQRMLTICPGVGSLTYIGGGSGTGQQAMIDGIQQVAPMSSPMSSSVCPNATYPNAQGYVHSLDGIAIFRNTATASCDEVASNKVITVTERNGTSGIQCPGCGEAGLPADQYRFEDFRDVLRVLYGGYGHDTIPTLDPCKAGPDSRSAYSAPTAGRCNTDLRRELVDNWNNLFQGACTEGNAGGACAGGLKHAFRRGDLSGTTDTFASILSLPSPRRPPLTGSVQKPFCNGDDQEDLDPVRRTCTGNPTPSATSTGEQACAGAASPWSAGPNGTLGVVLPIQVPEGVADSVRFPTNYCEFGLAGLAKMPPVWQALNLPCPNGQPMSAFRCRWPARPVGASPGVPLNNNISFDCINYRDNRMPGTTDATTDARAYNNLLRLATVGTTASLEIDNIASYPEGASSRSVVGAYYRLHQTRVTAGTGASPCTQADSTDQIGCLVQASPCSVGYSGLSAAETGATELALGRPDGSGGVMPVPLEVRKLLAATGPGCTDFATRYPLSRPLFVNTLIGFAATSGNEGALAACFGDRFYVDQAASFAGFVTRDDTSCASAGLGGACAVPTVNCF